MRPYADGSDSGRDDIDDVLADAQQRMATLRGEGRHETQEGSALQKKITDFKRLVELRQLVVGHPRSPSRLSISPRLTYRHHDISSVFRAFTHPFFIHTSLATIRHPMLYSSVLGYRLH